MSTCIAILSYNHPEITSRTIHSALKFNFPIILLHNGSLKKFEERLRNDFPAIEHISVEKNNGYANGANTLLSHAFRNFDWVLFLTNDTELLELDLLNIKEPALIAPHVYFRKLTRVDSMGGKFIPRYGKLLHIKDETNKLIKNKEFFYVPGTAFYIHREIFNSVGKFDERLHTYWEDVDFSMRVNFKKLPIYYSDSIKLIHRVGKTCHDNPFYSTYLFKRNWKKISLKYCHPLDKIFFLIVLVRDVVRNLYKLYITKDRSRFKLYLKAICE